MKREYRRATADQLWALCGLGSCQFWRGSPNGEEWMRPAAALAMSGEPDPQMNWAIVAAGGDAQADLRACVQRLRERQLPGYVLLASAVADDLAATARELGLGGPSRTPLMRREGHRSPPVDLRGLTVDFVRDAHGLRDAVAVAAAAFAADRELLGRAWSRVLLAPTAVELFVARRGAEPLSCVFATRTGGAVGIWAMATAPSRQRQGAGRALLSGVLSHHDDSADFFYLFASSAGRPLYESLGFAVIDVAANWTVPL